MDTLSFQYSPTYNNNTSYSYSLTENSSPQGGSMTLDIVSSATSSVATLAMSSGKLKKSLVQEAPLNYSITITIDIQYNGMLLFTISSSTMINSNDIMNNDLLTFENLNVKNYSMYTPTSITIPTKFVNDPTNIIPTDTVTIYYM